MNKIMTKGISLVLTIAMVISMFSSTAFAAQDSYSQHGSNSFEGQTEPAPTDSGSPQTSESPAPSESAAPSESPAPPESAAPSESPEPSEIPTPPESPEPSEPTESNNTDKISDTSNISGLIDENGYLTDEGLKSLKTLPYDPLKYNVERDNGDGTKSIKVYTSPVKFKDKDGKYKDIDNTIVETNSKDQSKYKYKNAASDVQILLSDDLTQENAIQMNYQDYSIGFKPLNILKDNDKSSASMNFTDAKDSNKNDNKYNRSKKYTAINYIGTFNKDTDISIMPYSEGIKEDIILNENPGITEFSYEITVENIVPLLRQDGNLYFIDLQKGMIVAAIPIPCMYDSSSESGVTDIPVTLENTGENTYVYTLYPDSTFLENAVYPVVIDPSISTPSGGVYDTYVKSTTSSNYCNDADIRMGRDASANKYRGLVQITPAELEYLRNTTQGYGITTVKYFAYENYDGASSPTTEIHAILAPWNYSTVNWSNQPVFHSLVYSSRIVTDVGWYNWDVTMLAQDWVYGTSEYCQGNVDDSQYWDSPTYGILIKHSDETVNKYKRYSSNQATSNKDYFQFTYLQKPAVTGTAYGNAANSGTGYVNLSWDSIPDADFYTVLMYNGSYYQSTGDGEIYNTSWTSQGKNLGLTPSEIAAGEYYFHTDHLGTELATDPSNVYANVRPEFGSIHNYRFQVLAWENNDDTIQRMVESDICEVTLTDRCAPNTPNAPTVIVTPGGESSGVYSTVEVSYTNVSDIPGIAPWDTTVNYQLYMSTNGGSYTQRSETPSNNKFTLTNLPDNTTYSFKIRAVDAEGNWSESNSTASDIYDRTGPELEETDVTITPPTWTNADPSITWGEITDEGGITTQLKYQFDSTGGNWEDLAAYSAHQYTLDCSSLTDGEHTIYIKACDAGGNSSDAVALIYRKDSAVPLVSITSPVEGAYVNGTIPVNGTASDSNIDNWILDYGEGISPSSWIEINTGATSVSGSSIGSWNTNPLTDGLVYTLRIRAWDKAGNLASSSLKVTKDSTLPVAIIASPSDNGFVNSTINVTGTVSDSSLDSWTLDFGEGESPSSWTEINTGTSAVSYDTLGSWNTTPLTDGTVYTLRIRAWDKAGNLGVSSIKVSKDSTEPAAAINSPLVNQFINGLLPVTGTASDTNISSWILDYGKGDSPSLWNTINTGTSSVSEDTLGSWDTSALTDGNYTLRLRVWDKANNLTTVSVKVEKDTTVPTALITLPIDDSYVNNTITVSGTVNDINLNNWTLDFGEGESPSFWTEISTGAKVITQGSVGSWNTTPLIDGSVYTLRLRVWDKAGNYAESSLKVTKDSTVPIIFISSPAQDEYVKGTVLVSGGVTDTNIGSWVLEYGAGATPEGWTQISNGTSSVNGILGSLNTGIIPDGLYTLRLRVTDLAGNSPDPLLMQVTADNTAPPIPADFSCTSIDDLNVLLAWTASTDNFGVTSYNIYRDGVIVGSTSDTSYTDLAPDDAAAYTYTVTAKDAAGNESAASTALYITTPDLTPPSAPTDLSCPEKEDTKVKLTWTASTDNVGVAYYIVYRNDVQLGTTINTMYIDSGLGAATTYTYTIKAKDAAGNISDASNTVNITTLVLFTYTVNTDNTLTITGYIGSATDVIIPATISGRTVSAIGNNAFINKTSIISFTIPNSVTSIGSYAFSECTNLANVVLSENITIINERTFNKCYSLTGIVIPNKVKTIGKYAFENCIGIINIVTPPSVTKIDDYAFDKCYNLNSVDFQGAVYIGYCSFYSAGIDTLIIYNSQTVIYGYSFMGCSELIYVDLNVKSIGARSFYNCDGLISANINADYIGSGAFQGCDSLQWVNIDTESIGFEAFRDCDQLSNVTMVNVKSIGYGAFQKTNLTSITIPEGVTVLEFNTFSDCPNLYSVNLGNKITSIGGYAFDNCKQLSSITIPDSVTSIGGGAFIRCSILRNVVLGNGITQINNYTFQDCTSLESMVIPDNITYLGNSAFKNCSNLYSINIPDCVTYLGTYAFSGCSKLPEVIIDNYDLEIGPSAFQDCYGLTKVDVIVDTIGDNAFSGCYNIETLDLSCVKSIGQQAFKGCSSIQELLIFYKETEIGDGAFQDCIGLTNVEILAKSIGNNAFTGCTGLTTLKLVVGLKSVGQQAFAGCANLTELTIGYPNLAEPSFLVSDLEIGNSAFMNCTKIQHAIVDAKTIGVCAFYGCTDLDTVFLGTSLTNIGNSAFAACSKLSDVYIFSRPLVMDNYSFNGTHDNLKLRFSPLKYQAPPWVPADIKTDGPFEKTIIIDPIEQIFKNVFQDNADVLDDLFKTKFFGNAAAFRSYLDKGAADMEAVKESIVNTYRNIYKFGVARANNANADLSSIPMEPVIWNWPKLDPQSTERTIAAYKELCVAAYQSEPFDIGWCDPNETDYSRCNAYIQTYGGEIFRDYYFKLTEIIAIDCLQWPLATAAGIPTDGTGTFLVNCFFDSLKDSKILCDEEYV